MAISTIGTNSLSDPIAVNATGALTGTVNGLTPQASNMQPFNRIINGAMTIDQRNAGASVTNIAGNVYTLDRWQANGDQASKFTIQQNAGSVTPPVGFINYLGITSSSAYSVGAAESFVIRQKIEGLNVADLGWGAAGAATVTLSFWVRSSLTGTFGGSISNSARNRSYPFSYTISTANTWEQKSVTIAGDTTGTWLTTTGIGIEIDFGLGVGTTYSSTAGSWSGATYISATGATSVVGTSGATFYITGVQLEAGSTASPFAHENYGDTLRKCERYFQKCDTWHGGANGSTAWLGIISVRTTMRASPSLGGTGVVTVSDFSSTDATQSSFSVGILNRGAGDTSLCAWIYNLSGMTGGKYYGGSRALNSNYLTLSAEL